MDATRTKSWVHLVWFELTATHHAQPVRALDDEGDDRVHWNCWLRKAVGGFLKCAVFFSMGKETCVLNLKPGFMCGEKNFEG